MVEIKKILQEYKLISSIVSGYTIYYIIRSIEQFSGQGFYLMLVLSLLSYVYLETDTFGGVNRNE